MKIPGKVYLVGGAVRDIAMGVEPKDLDYVVVGSTPEEMIAAGFKQVGADFPVFLHPETGEEFALARTERKSGNGYHGFVTDHSPTITLEEDLFRRDFTMNSMALEIGTGNIIDPFGGAMDIDSRRIKATSADTFIEDPVRLLRAARFACRYNFDLSVATENLCHQIINSGELEHLTAERVALEMNKALMEDKPSRFFTVLQQVGALSILFPEIHALIGQTQPEKYHAEGDAFVHTMMVLDLAAQESEYGLIRFCALTHDLGKGITPKELLPHHKGHEAAGVPLVEAMCDRLKLPSEFKRVGAKVARYHMHLHKLHEMRDKTLLKMFNELGGANTIIDMAVLAEVSDCDHRGRIRGDGVEIGEHPNVKMFMEVMYALKKVKLSNLKTSEEIKAMTIGQIKDTIRREQLRVIRETRKKSGAD